MKLVYYSKDTGQILSITPVKDVSMSDPFIEIADDLANDFFSGAKHSHQYIVSYNGELCLRYDSSLQQKILTIQDRIHLIPLHKTAGDFTVLQDINQKKITVSLTAKARDWWKNNNYFGQSHYFITACYPTDPHHVLCTFSFEVTKLCAEDVVFNYTNPAKIRFYTRKIFENYSHVISN